MTREDFRHTESLRVRWAEVDAQQIVFNGHYLMYVDTAVAGWWRALAVPYPEAVVAMGGDLYVRKATLEYEAAARHDERLTVGIRCSRIGRSSLGFDAAVWRDGQRLVKGELVYVYADPSTMRSQPLPGPLRAVIEAFEAGEPMLRTQTGDAAMLASTVRALGGSTAGDAGAWYAVGYNWLDAPVTWGRLRSEGGLARIEALWTLPALRGAGHGRALLQAMLRSASERGCRSVQVETASGTVAWFRRAGFFVVAESGAGDRQLLRYCAKNISV